jgi:hypothetical protein
MGYLYTYIFLDLPQNVASSLTSTTQLIHGENLLLGLELLPFPKSAPVSRKNAVEWLPVSVKVGRTNDRRIANSTY